MANGDDLQQSLLKELEESKKIYHVQTENQKIVVSGLAKCFLNVVMIHFTLNAFKNNLEEIQKETDPIKKAFLAYDISSGFLAISGMAAEVGGHIIKMATGMTAFKVTNFLTRHPYGESRLTSPKLKFAHGMKQVFDVTEKMLNFVSKGLGILAIVDGAIEILKGGDLLFNENDGIAGISKIVGGLTIIVGALMTLKLTTLMLSAEMVPIVGVIVTVAGVIIIYVSTLFERSNLERWFARCGFGIDHCRYALTEAGLAQALNDFSVLVSGLSVELSLMAPDENSELIYNSPQIGGIPFSISESNTDNFGFSHFSLYLNMTIQDFNIESDNLDIEITIIDKSKSSFKAKLFLSHNCAKKEFDIKPLENGFGPLLDLPAIILTNKKGKFHKYQSNVGEIDNSDETLKKVTQSLSTLIFRIKLAEIRQEIIPKLLFAIKIVYKKPDIINGDKIEKSQPIEQYYEFEGKNLLG
ncbi:MULTISPECIES: hypothetical protein [unclassified Gilliamella]|uniref:hypothetical protein n=1 Tax=unclassified Gilliamella TaxID=2685620 RepID=UPI001327E58E|nr:MULTISPECIES: hypothetical protein [unclassified Gilliamella]MWN31042.1 hypothetical protein [Gilliamella sp. Pra-s60]MWP28393.1 hypothetical protein [Gilliamella sp. Pra-s54]